jgi:hypothetical protein
MSVDILIFNIEYHPDKLPIVPNRVEVYVGYIIGCASGSTQRKATWIDFGDISTTQTGWDFVSL